MAVIYAEIAFVNKKGESKKVRFPMEKESYKAYHHPSVPKEWTDRMMLEEYRTYCKERWWGCPSIPVAMKSKSRIKRIRRPSNTWCFWRIWKPGNPWWKESFRDWHRFKERRWRKCAWKGKAYEKQQAKRAFPRRQCLKGSGKRKGTWRRSSKAGNSDEFRGNG